MRCSSLYTVDFHSCVSLLMSASLSALVIWGRDEDLNTSTQTFMLITFKVREAGMLGRCCCWGAATSVLLLCCQCAVLVY